MKLKLVLLLMLVAGVCWGNELEESLKAYAYDVYESTITFPNCKLCNKEVKAVYPFDDIIIFNPLETYVHEKCYFDFWDAMIFWSKITVSTEPYVPEMTIGIPSELKFLFDGKELP